MRLWKTLFLSFILLIGNFLNLQAQEDTFQIQKGNQLVYDVLFNGSAFEMKINLLALQPEMIFDWWLSIDATNSGTVRIPETALRRATSLYTKFDKGPKQLMNQSCMWLSEFAVNTGIENGEVVLRVNGEYRPYRFTGIETLVIYTSQGATSLECLKLKDEASRYEIWVLNDLDNLLIMKMQTDWSLQLKLVRENF